jgi:hypothetical protein
MLHTLHLKHTPHSNTIPGKLTTNQKIKSAAEDAGTTGCRKPRKDRVKIEEIIVHHP